MNIEVVIIDGPLNDARPELPAGAAGAVLCFEGIVRPTEDGRHIAGLHYEAYEPMASRMLRELADDTCRRFGLLAAFVEHSRGKVPVGRCSFRLQVASSHRKEALAAMDYFIDRLKRDVPIWKRAFTAGES